MLRIPIRGPPTPPTRSPGSKRAGSLRDTGLREGEKMSVILLLSGYVRNQATLDADIAAAMAAGVAGAQSMTSYGRTLARLTDPERFPALVPGPSPPASWTPRRARSARTTWTASSASAWNGCWTGSRP